MDQHGIDELAIHLSSLGHRNIGFVLSPHFQPLHEERLLRFRRTMQALELPHNLNKVCHVDPDDEAAPGRLLREVRGCTALMAADDFLAIKLKHLLARLSIAVPDDVSLCGFGNLSISHTLYPGLTTADTDREALCPDHHGADPGPAARRLRAAPVHLFDVGPASGVHEQNPAPTLLDIPIHWNLKILVYHYEPVPYPFSAASGTADRTDLHPASDEDAEGPRGRHA